MRSRSLPALLHGVLLLALAGLLATRAAPAEAEMKRSELVIETATKTHRFSVELARTPEERARGLMFRDRLPADAGMLFIYEHEQPIGMWMKNTLIPLNMLFIAGDGRILQIAERTVPLSTQVITAEQPARAVLELNGGTADRLGIEPGDRVQHPVFSAE